MYTQINNKNLEKIKTCKGKVLMKLYNNTPRKVENGNDVSVALDYISENKDITGISVHCSEIEVELLEYNSINLVTILNMLEWNMICILFDACSIAEENFETHIKGVLCNKIDSMNSELKEYKIKIIINKILEFV
jgi:hypothetical protein